ncbi:MAG: cytochrome c biogenesis protein CcsA [Trueperaceae bacterium]
MNDVRQSLRRPGWLNALGLVTLALFALGAYLALVRSPPDVNQGDLIRIMYAHVSAAWVCFLAVILAAIFGMLYLWRGRSIDDVRAVAHAESALLFAGLTIIGGMTYSRPTLNTFWTWDAKLTLTALLFALLVGYFVVRGLVDDSERRGRVSAVVSIIVLASLPFNWMAAEWFRTLHPAKSFDVSAAGVTDMAEPIFRWILLFNVLVAGLVYTWFVLERTRLGRLEANIVERREAPRGRREAVDV